MYYLELKLLSSENSMNVIWKLLKSYEKHIFNQEFREW